MADAATAAAAATVAGGPPPDYFAASAPPASKTPMTAASQPSAFGMSGHAPLNSQVSYASSSGGYAPGVGTFTPGTAGPMATSVLELSISAR